MNKSIFGLVAMVTIFFVSCGSDDTTTPENSNPSEVTLKTIENNPSTNYSFEWTAATDADGDIIVYDFYVNDKVVASDLTETQYSLLISSLDGVAYPFNVKVIAKDGKEGSSTSNQISIADPIIGKWNTFSQPDSSGEIIEVTGCKRMSLLEFKLNGTYDSTPYLEDQGECIVDGASSAKWKYVENGLYEFDAEGIKINVLVAFETDKLIIRPESDPSEILTYIKAN